MTRLKYPLHIQKVKSTETNDKEENIFSMVASLPYGPPVNTDIDYYQTYLDFIFVSVAMLVVRYLLGEEKPVLAL